MADVKCPNCGAEMVEAEMGSSHLVFAAPYQPRVSFWERLVGRNQTQVPSPQRGAACWQCGTLVLKVQNPAVFRPAEESAAELEAAPSPEGRGTELQAGDGT